MTRISKKRKVDLDIICKVLDENKICFTDIISDTDEMLIYILREHVITWKLINDLYDVLPTGMVIQILPIKNHKMLLRCVFIDTKKDRELL